MDVVLLVALLERRPEEGPKSKVLLRLEKEEEAPSWSAHGGVQALVLVLILEVETLGYCRIQLLPRLTCFNDQCVWTRRAITSVTHKHKQETREYVTRSSKRPNQRSHWSIDLDIDGCMAKRTRAMKNGKAFGV